MFKRLRDDLIVDATFNSFVTGGDPGLNSRSRSHSKSPQT